MKKILLSLITYVALAIPLIANSSTPSSPSSSPEPELLAQLAKASTASDSVKILYHLFDASPRAKQVDYGFMLLSTAGRAHDYAAQNDMIRQLTVLLSGDDKRMAEIINRSKSIPNSVDTHITNLFVTHQQLATQVQTMSEEERKKRLVNLLATDIEKKEQESIYDRIGRLYSIAIIAGEATQGQLYIDALEKLRALSDSLPAEGYPLRNQFYTALANIYTNTDRYSQAIQADRDILKIIDGLEENYKKAGRKYRTYAPMRYLSYRRMLMNYRALSPAEIQKLYSDIQSLAKTDPDVAKAEAKSPRTRAYFAMASGKYSEAIPLLQEMLANPKLRLNQRRQALQELRIAAEKTGNDRVLLNALKEYTHIIDKYDSLRTAEHLAELSVRYQLAGLQADNLRLQAEAGKTQLKHERQLRAYYVTAICLLLIMLFLLFLRVRKKS